MWVLFFNLFRSYLSEQVPGKSDTRFVTSAAKWEIEKVELSQSMRSVIDSCLLENHCLN